MGLKLKSICTAKETIAHRMGENIYDATDKELISKIYKQLMQLNINKTTPSKNGQKTSIDISPKTTKEKVLNIIIRKIQIKTTMKYHLTPVRMAMIKKSTNNKCCRGCGTKGTLLHCGQECKLV